MRNSKYLFTTFLLMAFMVGCMLFGDPEIDDNLSGIYYLDGPRTTVEEPCIHCPAGQDSLREFVSFSMIAKLDRNNPERIQFYGIQGADTGDFGKRVFPDCTRPAECQVFGEIISGGAFEIDIENNGHRYQATGFLSRYNIFLKSQYTYDGITIDYDLTGKRVSLELDCFLIRTRLQRKC